MPAASFTSLCSSTRNCVPQLGTNSGLDAIADRMMFRNAYRRFSDGHESLLDNYTVSANSVAGDPLDRIAAHATGKLGRFPAKHLSARYHLALDGKHCLR